MQAMCQLCQKFRGFDYKFQKKRGLGSFLVLWNSLAL
jgi:hypothetical protein